MKNLDLRIEQEFFKNELTEEEWALNYSGDIHAAFMVLNELVKQGWYYELSTYGGGGLDRRLDLRPDEDMLPNKKKITVTGKTETEVICLAALASLK